VWQRLRAGGAEDAQKVPQGRALACLMGVAMATAIFCPDGSKGRTDCTAKKNSPGRGGAVAWGWASLWIRFSFLKYFKK